METARYIDSASGPGGVRLPDSAQRQLDALRSAIEVRLAELEAALEDPMRADTLTGLVLDLARLSTTEAQATAARACQQLKFDSEAALLEADARTAAAVDAERRAGADVRRSLDALQKRLDLVESEKHALMQAAREQTQMLEGERSSRGDLDRTIAQLERQLEQGRADLADVQMRAQALRDERASAQQHVDALEARVADLEHTLSVERTSAQSLSAEHTQASERLAYTERQAADLAQQLAASTATIQTLQDARGGDSTRLSTTERELAEATENLAVARRAMHNAERDRTAAQQRLEAADVRVAELTRQLAASDDAATAAQQSVERERQAGSDTARLLADARRELSDLAGQLQAERSATADLRASLAAASTEGGDIAAALRQSAVDADARASEARTAAATLQATQQSLTESLEREQARVAELEASGQALTRSLDEARAQYEAERVRADALVEAQAWAQLSAQTPELPDDAGTTQVDAAVVDELRRALDAARADVAAVQQRLALLEAARATAEESAVDAQARVHTIEHERDALSLALDTERMMNADLRAALATAAKDAAERRQVAAPVAPAPPAPSTADGDDESEEMELTFEEDDQATEEAVITLDEQGWESVRMSTRYRFNTRVDIKVNNQLAALADLSVGGCGVVSRKALETSERVRVQLPGDPMPLICVGTVVWVRKEHGTQGSALQYRAGVQFTQADQAAIEAFIIMRADV